MHEAFDAVVEVEALFRHPERVLSTLRAPLALPYEHVLLQLSQQRNLGEQIAAQLRGSPERVDAVQANWARWWQTTERVLRDSFADDSVAREFSLGSTRSYEVPQSAATKIRMLLEEMEEVLARLAVVERAVPPMSLRPPPRHSGWSTRRSVSGQDTVLVVSGSATPEQDPVVVCLRRYRVCLDVAQLEHVGDERLARRYNRQSPPGFLVITLPKGAPGVIGQQDDRVAPLVGISLSASLGLGYFLGLTTVERALAFYSEARLVPLGLLGVHCCYRDRVGVWKTLLGRALKEAGFNLDLNLSVG